MMKILSIITVCYNSEKTIEKCINSIINQMNSAVKYISVEGKSTYNTINIIKKYKNIKYVSEKDSGIYDAMNKGIKMSEGKYIQFMNSDDCLVEGVLKKVLPILSSSDEDVIYGNTIFKFNLENKIYGKKVIAGEDLSKLDRRSILCHQSTFTKKETLQKIGYFDTQYKIAADWDSFIKIRNNKGTFKHIDNIISLFSIDGVSSTKSHLMERKKIRKNNKIYKYIDLYFILDVVDVILMKLKQYAKMINMDVEKYRIKKGIYKEMR